MSDKTQTRVCVYGAGSVGVYVGGRLRATGVPVSLIGRPRIGEQLQAHGLHLSDWQGAKVDLAPHEIDFHTDDVIAEAADLIIVTVKSAATEEVGRALAGRLARDTVVMSLQNGIGNARVLARHLPDNPVLSGMISFNIVQQGEGRFHAGTEGELMSAPHPLLQALLPFFREGAVPLELREDMPEVQWAKLLMNLNNAINALSGIPLFDELSQRDYRRCLALLVSETLALLQRAEIQPAKLMPIPMRLLPRLLDSPDWLFRRLARRLLAIDPLARSSMWEDLEAGRPTEIDWINGEVLRLAQRLGETAPANTRIVELIRAAEQGGRRNWSGAELLATLRGY